MPHYTEPRLPGACVKELATQMVSCQDPAACYLQAEIGVLAVFVSLASLHPSLVSDGGELVHA